MNRPLDPVSLKHFVAVCEEGSIQRAAEREALVASALSKRITALEGELGVALLVRRRRGVQPTDAGQALLQRARELLSHLDQLRAELAAYGQGVQGSVRVLASPSALAEELPDDVARFGARHPGIRIGLEERASQDVVRGLRHGTADLGVLWDAPGELDGLERLPYRSDRLCVAVSPDHPLARRPSLRHADTLDHDSIGVVPGGQIDRLLRRQAALAGRVPTYRMQVSSIDVACRLVAAGLGLAILPMEAALPHAGAGRLRFVALDEPWALRRFVVVRRAGEAGSAAARMLADELTAAAGDAGPEPGLPPAD